VITEGRGVHDRAAVEISRITERVEGERTIDDE